MSNLVSIVRSQPYDKFAFYATTTLASVVMQIAFSVLVLDLSTRVTSDTLNPLTIGLLSLATGGLIQCIASVINKLSGCIGGGSIKYIPLMYGAFASSTIALLGGTSSALKCAQTVAMAIIATFISPNFNHMKDTNMRLITSIVIGLSCSALFENYGLSKQKLQIFVGLFSMLAMGLQMAKEQVLARRLGQITQMESRYY